MTTATITFIGAGNMANAIIAGLVKNDYPADYIIACDHDANKLQDLQQRYSIHISSNNNEAIQQANVVILAVKPQHMPAVCHEIVDTVKQYRPLLISIAAGITISQLTALYDKQTAIVRCMPNTPALVGEGMSGLVANVQVTSAQKQLTDSIFQSIGKILWLEQEALIDAVIAVSGSGPAYYFLFMEAMIETGIDMGLSPDSARQLTQQTCLGAALMVQQHQGAISELRQQVTSTGGTTQHALDTFTSYDFKNIVTEAMQAAKQRAAEISDDLK